MFFKIHSFPHKIVHGFFSFLARARCPAYLILNDLVTTNVYRRVRIFKFLIL